MLSINNELLYHDVLLGIFIPIDNHWLLLSTNKAFTILGKIEIMGVNKQVEKLPLYPLSMSKFYTIITDNLANQKQCVKFAVYQSFLSKA